MTPNGRVGRLRLLDFPQLVAARRDALERKRLLREPDLTYLFWECTLRCNLHCLHCGSSCEAHSPLVELTTDQIKGVLDTIREDFDTSRIFVSITGGEPLLRPDLAEVVAHMTHLGLRSCIVTNGVLLDEARACELAQAGMETITVSVDGLEVEHESVRGKGTYGKALAALGAARKAGMATVEAVTCVRPANLGSLAAIERAVRDAGATLSRLLTIDRMGRLALTKSPEMWLDAKGLRTLFDYVEARRAEILCTDESFDVRFSCGGFLGLRRDFRVRPRNSHCYAGSQIASILCDGGVGACPSIPREWARQGSVLEQRFSTLWRERFEKYRDLSWRKEGLCDGCSWFETCLGGGLHERLVQPEEFCWLDRQEG